MMRDELLAAYNIGQRDFREESLQGLNLGSSVLTGANFSGANLEGAILEDAQLAGCCFRKANLKNAHMSRCHMGRTRAAASRLAAKLALQQICMWLIFLVFALHPPALQYMAGSMVVWAACLLSAALLRWSLTRQFDQVLFLLWWGRQTLIFSSVLLAMAFLAAIVNKNFWLIPIPQLGLMCVAWWVSRREPAPNSEWRKFWISLIVNGGTDLFEADLTNADLSNARIGNTPSYSI